jgi:hypothetical protein
MDEIVVNRIASKLTLIHEELQRIQSTLDQLRVALGDRR